MMTLRAPEPDDINIIYIWDNSTDECHSSLRTGPMSRHQIADWVDRYNGDIFDMGGLRFMIDVDGRTVGTVDVFDFDRRSRHAFVGIYIEPGSRRRGYARDAINAVCQRMARDVGMHSLAALVSADNIASQAFFADAGFSYIGSLKGWISDHVDRFDALIFQRML